MLLIAFRFKGRKGPDLEQAGAKFAWNFMSRNLPLPPLIGERLVSSPSKLARLAPNYKHLKTPVGPPIDATRFVQSIKQ